MNGLFSFLLYVALQSSSVSFSFAFRAPFCFCFCLRVLLLFSFSVLFAVIDEVDVRTLLFHIYEKVRTNGTLCFQCFFFYYFLRCSFFIIIFFFGGLFRQPVVSFVFQLTRSKRGTVNDRRGVCKLWRAST